MRSAISAQSRESWVGVTFERVASFSGDYAARSSICGPEFPAAARTMSVGHYSELLRQIRDRVRPVCSEMPQDEFDALTARMAEIEWKYTHRAAAPGPDPSELETERPGARPL
jgi:hypothetical protein